MKEKRRDYASETVPKSERMKNEADRRKKLKRRAEIRLGLLLLALIVIIGAVFSIFYFKAKKVTVVNAAIRYSDAEIAAAAGIKEDESLLLLNADAVSARILRQLPYIGEATVKRRIPDEVVITVEYAKPTLAVETGIGYVLLDSAGKVLQTGVSRLADYTALVYGSNVTEATPGQTVVFEDEGFLEKLTKLVSEFEAAGFHNVTAYDLNDLTDVVVEVNFYINVRFGNINRIAGKLKFGKAAIESQLKKGGANPAKLVVDLTDGNTAIVRTQSAIEASKEAARRNKFLASLTPEERASLEASEKAAASAEDAANADPDDGGEGYDEDYDEDDGYDYDEDYDEDYDADYDADYEESYGADDGEDYGADDGGE